MKITSDKTGASVLVEEMVLVGSGVGGMDEYENTVLSVRLTPDQCVEHALELLEGRVKPGALEVIKRFGGKEVVVTEKMDGENCTMYSDYIHARSLEYSSHPSRDRVKAMHALIAHDIPKGWRVCGENLYALHSIAYDDLSSYFQVFSIWNDKNVCLSWDETKEWAALLGFPTVSSISRFTWQPELTYRESSRVATLTPERWMNYQWDQASIYADRQSEGYVVRLAGEFHYKDFRRSVAKYVRKDHVVHRDGHWSNRPVVPNKLRGK